MRHTPDPHLVFATAVLLASGALIHFSLAPSNITIHLFFITVGILLAIITSKLDNSFFSHLAPHFYLFSLLLLILTLTVGVATRGSTRWLDLGFFRFQPSEFAKPPLILSFAQFISATQITKVKNLLFIVALSIPPIFLIFLQPDLGSAIIISAIIFAMLFAQGLRFRHLLAFLLIFALATPIMWSNLKPYQQSRILTFTNPNTDPLGKGYNTIQSLIAVGSGQLFGRGLGHGTQSQLKFLPEHQTDFVFASFAEELGLLGGLVIITSYTWLILRFFHFAQRSKSKFHFLTFIGLIAMLGSQALINISMNIALLPITGITLPFISTGGSSMIASLLAIGIGINLAKDSKTRLSVEIT